MNLKFSIGTLTRFLGLAINRMSISDAPTHSKGDDIMAIVTNI